MQFNTTYTRYTKELSHKCYDPLPIDEERRIVNLYFTAIKQKNEAVADNKEEDAVKYSHVASTHLIKLTSSYLRFVLHMLKKSKVPDCIDIMDLIQEGNLGLMESIKRFRPDLFQSRIASYAAHWIRFYVLQLLNIEKVKKTRVGGIPEEDTLELSSESEEEVVVKTAATQDILDYVSTALTEREIFVIKHFFGLNSPQRTLQDIGSMLHISAERVRQVKNCALEKLNKSKFISIL